MNVCVCLYAYMNTLERDCVCILTYKCIHVWMHCYIWGTGGYGTTHNKTCSHACMHVCVYTHMHSYLYAYVHVYAYIHIYIHISVCTFVCSLVHQLLDPMLQIHVCNCAFIYIGNDTPRINIGRRLLRLLYYPTYSL